MDTKTLLSNAWSRALGGGVPGLFAMFFQVGSLMWLHTTLNYQYRYGTSTREALRALWMQGGIPRLYQGFSAALVLAPTTKFIDTAANSGCVWLLDNSPTTASLPLAFKTAFGSACAGAARMALMPLDALKTTLQVEGAAGVTLLRNKVAAGGAGVLFHGAVAAGTASTISHFPWFAVYNYMDRWMAEYDTMAKNLCRNAAIGFTASTASAVISNWVRVIKTAKQTSVHATTYPEVIAMIVRDDGVMGLAARGLGTKILATGLQGIMFTILWKLGQQAWSIDEGPPGPAHSQGQSQPAGPVSGNSQVASKSGSSYKYVASAMPTFASGQRITGACQREVAQGAASKASEARAWACRHSSTYGNMTHRLWLDWRQASSLNQRLNGAWWAQGCAASALTGRRPATHAWEQ